MALLGFTHLQLMAQHLDLYHWGPATMKSFLFPEYANYYTKPEYHICKYGKNLNF